MYSNSVSQLLKCKKRVTFDRRRSQKIILRFDFCLEPQYSLKYKSRYLFFLIQHRNHKKIEFSKPSMKIVYS